MPNKDSKTYIVNDQATEIDSLDFAPYVETLADIIQTGNTPLTIGVFGTWGSGKTSLMKMIKNGIPESKYRGLPNNYAVVWFDAWKYDKEETLWRVFLLSVLAQIKKIAESKNEPLDALEYLEMMLYRAVDIEKVGDVKIDLLKLGGLFAKGTVQLGLSFIPGGAVLGKFVEEVQKSGTKALTEDFTQAIQRERTKIHIEQVHFLEQFQDKFKGLIKQYIEPNRLVVFVDDLDRCIPEKAIEVLEAIKLFLDAENCIFVLGLDQEVIARGIEVKYKELGAKQDGDNQQHFTVEGARYLEKIIQLPFQIPPVEQADMGDFVHALSSEWPHEECPKVFAEGLGDNPRQIKRTVNTFLMLWKLADKRKDKLQGRIKPIRLAKIVAIQTVFPDLYALRLKEEPRYLKELEEYYRAEVLDDIRGEKNETGVEKAFSAARVEAPRALLPFMSRREASAVRRILTYHQPDMEDANFASLRTDELKLYITLTSRAEAPPLPASPVEVEIAPSLMPDRAEAPAIQPLYQLPQPPADFTGREPLVTQLLEDFDSQKSPKIIGLTGMGGIGKTALALVVAHKVAQDYPDAQIFLDLKGTTAPLSARDIMHHVILSFEPTADLRALDETNLLDAYRSVLHEKKALLFFDNARSAKQIAPLRPPETCAMLVTSRWTFGVPGLQLRRVDVMSKENAQAFLLELCPRIADQAAELAQACAYLPLTLRIAGSFLQVNEDWEVEKYLSQLHDRKQRLATFVESRAEAELTTEPDLLATFELSYSQLSEGNQKHWRMLGVFPASFDLPAASAMWGLDEKETTKLLGLLRRYSLLEYDETISRYGLHDLLADFALSQMENEEEHEARLKHVSHYKDVLSVADDLYLKGDDKILLGLRLFDLEWENIRTAQAWVVTAQGDHPDLAKLCMAYPAAGAYVLSLRLHPQKQIEWWQAGLSAARELGDRRGEGQILGNLANAYADLGDVRKAIELHEQSLVIAREIEDRRGEGQILGNLGNAYAALGDAHKAIELHEQSLVIAREIGDRRGEGRVLGNLGSAYYSLGDARKAVEFHEQSLVIAREIGDRLGEGSALGNLGNAYYRLGDARKAIEFQEQYLVIAREIGHLRGEGVALGNLGLAYAALGDARKAIEFYEQYLVIAREIGDRHGEGNALANMGLALYDLEEKDRAIDLTKQALDILEAIESPYAEKARKKLREWGLLPKEGE